MSFKEREEKKHRTYSDAISEGQSDFSMDAFPMISPHQPDQALKQIARLSC